MMKSSVNEEGMTSKCGAANPQATKESVNVVDKYGP